MITFQCVIGVVLFSRRATTLVSICTALSVPCAQLQKINLHEFCIVINNIYDYIQNVVDLNFLKRKCHFPPLMWEQHPANWAPAKFVFSFLGHTTRVNPDGLTTGPWWPPNMSHIRRILPTWDSFHMFAMPIFSCLVAITTSQVSQHTFSTGLCLCCLVSVTRI